MIPQLRPFQTDLVERVACRAREGRRIIVVQGSTGCGKTTIAGAIVKRAADKERSALFLAHRRKIVDQISGRLHDFEINHNVFMRDSYQRNGSRIVVASRDTLVSQCLDNRFHCLPPADLVVVDECHHAGADDSEYRRILHEYPRATILLLSATPVTTEGRGLGPWAQAIECAAPTSELVKLGFLCPVRIYCPDRKKNRQGKVRRGVAGNIVDSWKMFARGMPTVLFLSRVQHSRAAVASFVAEGIPADHVDADTPDGKRDAIFDKLADGRLKIVSNVGIIGEGVDIPELGCCQVACEVTGRVKWLQATGRVMRPSIGKTEAVIIDHSGAVFRHGFPDEDTHWSLEGNVDEQYKRAHDDGKTVPAFYCTHCQEAYQGSPPCPTCGRFPTKKERSIFAAPAFECNNELLVEADRGGTREDYDYEARKKHWLRCLAVAVAKNSTFGMAAVMYKKKYVAFPENNFPCFPPRDGWKTKVADLYPNFNRRKAQ